MPVTAQVRGRVQKGGERFWTTADLGAVAGPAVVDRILHHLVQNGDLRAIRRGLYWRGHRTLYGMSHPSTEQIVAVVAGARGVGPAGITAANDLGLTTQVPAVEAVAIPRRPPRPIPGIPLRFVDRSGRPARAACRLWSDEVAVLEVLSAWDDVVELPTDAAMGRLAALVRSGDIRADKLAAASVDEPASTRGRLRALLAVVGRPDLVDAVRPPRRQLTIT